MVLAEDELRKLQKELEGSESLALVVVEKNPNGLVDGEGGKVSEGIREGEDGRVLGVM